MMTNNRQFKVCGITRASDAQAAAMAGADFIGFIFYEKSPRRIDLDGFRQLRDELPDVDKVAVLVKPDRELIDALKAVGFRHFQVHFEMEGDYLDRVAQWRKAVGDSELWLAPKIGPGGSFDGALIPFADAILWDGYSKGAFGGTGKHSDWAAFQQLSGKYPEKKWILAGGLNPESLESAVTESGSRIFDFNSGLETSPGIKDPRRIAEVGGLLAAL